MRCIYILPDPLPFAPTFLIPNFQPLREPLIHIGDRARGFQKNRKIVIASTTYLLIFIYFYFFLRLLTLFVKMESIPLYRKSARVPPEGKLRLRVNKYFVLYSYSIDGEPNLNRLENRKNRTFSRTSSNRQSPIYQHTPML